MHTGKQIWYCDSKRNAIWENTSFWRKSRFYLSESWKTSRWILNILSNPYMSHAQNKHRVWNFVFVLNIHFWKGYIASFNGEKYGNQMIRRHCFNQHHISPNHGKHPPESSGTLLMHLSESCVRKKCFSSNKQHCSSSDHMVIKCQLK